MPLPFNPYRKQLVVSAAVTWLIFALMLLIVVPAFVKDVVWSNSYLPFFILLMLGLFASLSAITGRWKRSGLWSFIITAGFWLRINQLDSVINTGLLLAFGLIWEYYWRMAKPEPAKDG